MRCSTCVKRVLTFHDGGDTGDMFVAALSPIFCSLMSAAWLSFTSDLYFIEPEVKCSIYEKLTTVENNEKLAL